MYSFAHFTWMLRPQSPHLCRLPNSSLSFSAFSCWASILASATGNGWSDGPTMISETVGVFEPPGMPSPNKALLSISADIAACFSLALLGRMKIELIVLDLLIGASFTAGSSLGSAQMKHSVSSLGGTDAVLFLLILWSRVF